MNKRDEIPQETVVDWTSPHILPANEGWYLVTMVSDEIDHPDEVEITYYSLVKGKPNIYWSKVTAWAPLPKAYRP